jgi:glucose dehydrogenase
VKDGKELWRSREQDVACSAPMTYMVDGKQYVSIIAGNPGNACIGRARATLEYPRPAESVVLWTYQLP